MSLSFKITCKQLAKKGLKSIYCIFGHIRPIFLDIPTYPKIEHPLWTFPQFLNMSEFFWYNVTTRATSSTSTDFSANVIIMRLDDDEN